MIESTFPLLSITIVLPLLGALATGLATNNRLAKYIALWVAVAELLLTLSAWWLFKPEDGNRFQLVEQRAWIPSLNMEYLLGIDGISVLFLPMTALLAVLAIAASWTSVQHLQRLHFALLLALEGITIGVFCALDTMLFFLFWELTLPPIFFLIGLWGIGTLRRTAAMKYTLFMLFGGVPLLFAFVLLAINHATEVNGALPQNLSFSLPVLLATPVSEHLQTVVFVLLLLGFAVKAPLIPFHTWLPTATMEGPTQITALLIGLKLGIYGIVRFTLPLAPSAAVGFNWILGILGAVTLVYGGLIALQQSNLRRLLAYASISHVGLVIIGIASLTVQGIQGAIFQLFNFSLIASSLMLIAGFIHQRLASTEAVHLGGLAKVMPRLSTFYFLFMLASIGVPGTNGFPSELLLIFGALSAHPGLGLTALAGAVLSAAYMLSYTRRAFWGPITQTAVSQSQDLRPRELALLCIPALLVLWFGFFPNTALSVNQVAAEAWLSRLLEPPQMPNNDVVGLWQGR